MKLTKKITSVLAAAAIAATMTACGEDAPATPTDPTGTTAADGSTAAPTSGAVQASANGYKFKHGSHEVILGTRAADLLAALGTPLSTFEEESCAFPGIDYMYTYAGVQYNTFSTGEDDYILAIILGDDTVMTPEGAYIGMTKDQITGIYGTPAESDAGKVKYVKDGMNLTFSLDGETVKGITYYFDRSAEFAID